MTVEAAERVGVVDSHMTDERANRKCFGHSDLVGRLLLSADIKGSSYCDEWRYVVDVDDRDDHLQREVKHLLSDIVQLDSEMRTGWN